MAKYLKWKPLPSFSIYLIVTSEELESLRRWVEQPRNGPSITIPSSYYSDEAVLRDAEMLTVEHRQHAARESRYDIEGIGGLEPIVREHKPNGGSPAKKSGRQNNFESGSAGQVLFSAIFNGSKSYSIRMVNAYLTELSHRQPDVFQSDPFSDSVLFALFQAKQSILREPSVVIQLKLLDRLEAIAVVAFRQLDERPAFSLFRNGSNSTSYSEEQASVNGARRRNKPPFVYSTRNGHHPVPEKPVNVSPPREAYAPGRVVPPPLPNVVYDSVFGAAVIPVSRR